VDPLSQGIGDVVLAAVGDHLAQVGLEVKGTETRTAFVEMHLDLHAAFVGELPVEIVVEPFDRVIAIELRLL